MSVQNPHHFSPLWLFNNSKQLSGQKTSKSGFASLNGGHVPVKRSYSEDAPATIITHLNSSFKTSEFPSLQSSKPRQSVTVNSGAWSTTTAPSRNKGKLYNSANKGGGKTQTATGGTTTRPRSNTQGDADKPSPTKSKGAKSSETTGSKFDFFNSLRLDEGLVDSELDNTSFENECDGVNCVDSQNSTPLSSSVETEHRLLKVMGWSEEQEPPLTEEEVLSARREMENHRRPDTNSPTTLSPFPWAPKFYLPSEEEDLSSDSEDEN